MSGSRPSRDGSSERQGAAPNSSPGRTSDDPRACAGVSWRGAGRFALQEADTSADTPATPPTVRLLDDHPIHPALRLGGQGRPEPVVRRSGRGGAAQRVDGVFSPEAHGRWSYRLQDPGDGRRLPEERPELPVARRAGGSSGQDDPGHERSEVRRRMETCRPGAHPRPGFGRGPRPGPAVEPGMLGHRGGDDDFVASAPLAADQRGHRHARCAVGHDVQQ